MFNQTTSKIFLIVILFLMFNTKANADVTSGLIASWPLDEGSGLNAADTSRKGNSATLLNGPVWNTGKLGKAIELDGRDDMLKINTPKFDLTGNISISVWFNQSTIRGADKATLIFGSDQERLAPRFVLYADRINKRLCAMSNSHIVQCSNHNSYTPGTWTHAVLVRPTDGRSIKFYVNGIYKGTVDTDKPVASATIRIGGFALNNLSMFGGMIDDIRVYNQLLTESEINALLAMGSPAASTPAPILTPQPIPTPAPKPAPQTASFVATLTLNSSTVTVGSNITVNWKVTSGTPSVKDWISLYTPNSTNETYLTQNWTYTKGTTSGSFTTKAPSTPGTYEFRYLLNNGYTSVTKSASIAVTAVAAPAPTPTPQPASLQTMLILSSSKVTVGSNITVNWQITSGSPSLKDWISLYLLNSNNQTFIKDTWTYTKGTTSGNFTINAPSTPGLYEFRYLLNNGFTSVMKSSVITVTQPTAAPIPTPTTTPTPTTMICGNNSCESGETQQNCPQDCAPVPSGKGSILIERHGEHAKGLETAPYAMTWVNSLSSTPKNSNIYSDLPAGHHTVHTQNIHGLVESAGTCIYALGEPICQVSNFPLTPQCNNTSCSIDVTVLGNKITKVVFKYVGVYEGFGAKTVGGRNGTVYHVTNLNKIGPGSLRDAVSQPNRYIVFDVAGTIDLGPGDELTKDTGTLLIHTNRLTIDGFTAPYPGITLTNSIDTRCWENAHQCSSKYDPYEIIVRALRIRKNSAGGQHGISFSSPGQVKKVHNIVVDHNAVSGSNDDMIIAWGGSYDITFSWNVMDAAGGSNQNMLFGAGAERISVHHNFFTGSAYRNPMVTFSGERKNPHAESYPPHIVADIRNNFMALSTHGTMHWRASRTNVVKNYYLLMKKTGNDFRHMAINMQVHACNPLDSWGDQWIGGNTCLISGWQKEWVTIAGLHTEGNVVVSPYGPPSAVNLNLLDDYAGGNPLAFPAPVYPSETDAFSAACRVIAEAGVKPLDTIDQPFFTEARQEISKYGNCNVNPPRPNSQPHSTFKLFEGVKTTAAVQTRYYPSSQWAVNGTVPAGTLGTIMQEQPYQPRPDDNWYFMNPSDSSWWWSVKFDNGQGNAIYGWVKESELVKANLSSDFFLSNSGNISTEPGQTVSTQIQATQLTGNSEVKFSVIIPSNLQATVSPNFSHPSCFATCSTTLTFKTTVNTPLGWHQVQVIGSGGGRSMATRFWLWIDGFSGTTSISISATDPIASETGDQGAFTITRTGSTIAPLKVWYNVLGSALWQEDYDGPVLSGSIVIPAGANQVLLPITPKRDAIKEGNETITIRLTNSPITYNVSAPYEATIMLQDMQN